MGHNASSDRSLAAPMNLPEFHRRPGRREHHHFPPGGRHRCLCGDPGHGEQGLERPTITVTAADGLRVATVERPDGSTFTVTVPAGAREVEGATPWITEHGAPRTPSDSALQRLGDVVFTAPPRRPPPRRSASVVNHPRLAW
jgi:hypothetical protein